MGCCIRDVALSAQRPRAARPSRWRPASVSPATDLRPAGEVLRGLQALAGALGFARPVDLPPRERTARDHGGDHGGDHDGDHDGAVEDPPVRGRFSKAPNLQMYLLMVVALVWRYVAVARSVAFGTTPMSARCAQAACSAVRRRGRRPPVGAPPRRVLSYVLLPGRFVLVRAKQGRVRLAPRSAWPEALLDARARPRRDGFCHARSRRVGLFRSTRVA